MSKDVLYLEGWDYANERQVKAGPLASRRALLPSADELVPPSVFQSSKEDVRVALNSYFPKPCLF